MTKFKDKNIIRLGLAFGHIVECFDNTIYGFFAVLLAPLFFPSSDPSVQITLSFEAFAAGFIARPLGSLFFGLIGDSKHRALSLSYSMVLVGIPTLIIGLLPTYQSIGIWAPILLIVCRIFQGFFFGGEFAGATLSLFESSPTHTLGRNSSRLIAIGVMGAILAACTGFFVTLPHQPEWMWRLPFILGGCLAFISYFFRRKLIFFDQTHAQDFTYSKFQDVLCELMHRHKIKTVFSILISGLTVVPLYLVTFYANKVFKELGFTYSQAMIFNTFALLLNAGCIGCFGPLADRFGFDRLITLGCISNIICAIPAFLIMNAFPKNIIATLSFIAILVTSGCIINSCTMPYIARLFPYKIRYTGLALSHGIGISLFGGLTPIFALCFKNFFHHEIGPSAYLIGLSTLVLIFKKLI